jgi:hypothetical protein
MMSQDKDLEERIKRRRMRSEAGKDGIMQEASRSLS